MKRREGPPNRGSPYANAYTPKDYNSWRQVAGYFDGDGAVYVSIKKFVLKIRLCFYDVWRPQLEAIRDFMISKGVKTRRLAVQRRKLGEVSYLTIGDPVYIQAVIRKILPFSCKKRGDLLVALEYLDNKVTADEAIQKLNELIKDNRRSGYVRKARIPYTRSEGILEGRRFGAAAGARAVMVRVPDSVQEEIRIDRREHRSSLRELHLKIRLYSARY
ncbi:MAG: hypothetical protein HYY68_04915 [Thaumarchaeota archaeon]|nr:hypothetical protein [Nitrososphaerota archaeon]